MLYYVRFEKMGLSDFEFVVELCKGDGNEMVSESDPETYYNDFFPRKCF